MLSQSFRAVPSNYLLCVVAPARSGEDYTVASKVEEYQRSIRTKLGQRLEYCEGNVVVLFDELQKVVPGTLNGETKQGRGRGGEEGK